MSNELRRKTEEVVQKLHKQQDTTSQQLTSGEQKIPKAEKQLSQDTLIQLFLELEKSNKWFYELFDHAPVGYFLINSNTEIIKANYSSDFLIHYPAQKIVGQNLSEYIHPEFQEDFTSFIREVIERKQLHTGETKIRTSENNYTFIQLQARMDFESSSLQPFIRLVIVDISKRKTLEKELLRFRAAIDSTIDNIFLLDYDTGYFLDVNDTACKNLGYNREELIGMKPKDINPAYSQDLVQKIRNQSLKSVQNGYTTEIKHEKKNGEIIEVEVYLRITTIGEDKIIVAVARDITERKRTQEKLSKYAEELKELNASKDKFLSIISHDLRGPFLGIKGYTQMLLEEYDMMEKEEVNNFLQIIHDSSKDLYTLVDNLLKWSRMELGKTSYEPMSFNLKEELEPIFKLMSGIATKKEITLENHLQEGIYPYGDKLMLISVTQNLVSNAIKFTPKNGKVILASRQNNGMVEVSVKDTGVGMSAEVVNNLFTLDTGHTSKGTAGEKGTGFGLLIARNMVKKMGGEIWVESSPGIGTVFTFSMQNAE